MAYKIKAYETFTKGLVTHIADEKLADEAASEARNFLDLGDRVELIRGSLRVADEGDASGEVGGLTAATDIEGTEYLYKKQGTTLKRYDADADTWTTVITGLTPGEDMSLSPYRTPAGSFLWASSPTSGLYRINLANPDSYVDLYDGAKNFKGWITIHANRMWLWGNVGYETILYISWIDNDYPYAEITGESVGTGNGILKTFTGTTAQPLVVGHSVVITDSTETFTDNGNGVLTGSAGGTGTINYTTGAYSVTFAVAPGGAVPITIDYSYETPKVEGLADFTYTSPTRLAGEGSFFTQFQGNDEITAVVPYDEEFYCFHKKSIWRVDLTTDDTNASNQIYRDNTGAPNFRSVWAYGDGIYYIDNADESGPKLRILSYDEIGLKVEPTDVAAQLDLAGYDFSDGAIVKFGDYIIYNGRTSTDVGYNDVAFLYNTRWELFDTADWTQRVFAVYNDKLHGGSSVDLNAYELFSGFDDDDSVIEGAWANNDSILNTEELKKCKKFIVEGDMAESQTLIVEVSYDGEDYVELGTIAGTSKYVNRGASTEYGKVTYGGGTYGSGETVTAYRYMREFKLGSDKFYRAKVRFRTESYGYLNVKKFIYKDIRLKGYKLPTKFR